MEVLIMGRCVDREKAIDLINNEIDFFEQGGLDNLNKNYGMYGMHTMLLVIIRHGCVSIV